MSRISDLLKVTIENKCRAWDMHGKTKGGVSADVRSLKRWLKKQRPFPKGESDERLERILLRNKFALNRAKSSLDFYYTLRGVHREFFINTNPSSEAMQNLRDACLFVFLPNLSPSLERIMFLKFLPNLEAGFNIIDLFAHIFCVMDLCITYDYAVGERLVIDMQNLRPDHIKSIDATELNNCLDMYKLAYSGNITTIDYFNAPNFLHEVLEVMNWPKKKKWCNTAKLHPDLESLYDSLPQRYFPNEYGGEQGYLPELYVKWNRELGHSNDWLDQNRRRVSLESVREILPPRDDTFGAYGIFRRLNTDC